MTRSWTPALILLLALVPPQLLIGLAAGRDRQLSSDSGTVSSACPRGAERVEDH
jgi:hypothetical protein